MIYYAIKLNDSSYLGQKKGQEIDNIENARCYKTLKTAEKVAISFKDCPWYKEAKVVQRVTVQTEFGGSYFLERIQEPIS